MKKNKKPIHSSSKSFYYEIKISKAERLCTKPSLSYLILSYLILMLPNQAFAQPECNDLAFNFCPVTAPASASNNCTAPGCFTMQYEFTFNATGSNTATTFHPEILAFVAHLQIPNGGISRINESATQACLENEYGFQAGEYEINVDGHYVTILLEQDQDPLNLPVGTPFMAIVIDAFPNETLDLSISDGFFVKGGESCTLPVQNCNTGATSVFFPEPTNQGYIMDMGEPTYFLATNHYEIPVFFQAGINPVNFSELDIAWNINSAIPLQQPEIIPGILSSASTQFELRVQENGQGGYYIYAHAWDFSYDPSEDDPIFTIKVNGSHIASLQNVATISFHNGRTESAAGCKKPFTGTNPVHTLPFQGCDYCPDNIRFEVSEHIETSDCEQIFIAATIDWDDPPEAYDVVELLLEFSMDLTGDVTINNMIIDGWACPGGCFSVIGNNTVRYYYQGLPPLYIAKGTSIVIELDAPNGCVEDITFLDAKFSTLGTPVPICVPSLVKEEADFPLCTPMVRGTILKEDDMNVEGFELDIMHTLGTCPAYSFNTSCAEGYAQCVCDQSGTYTVTPSYDLNDICGLTTFDQVLMMKHLTGVELFDSPFEFIAADVNNSGSFTVFDVVELRKVVLFINESFPNNTSWRFVDKDHEFVGDPNITGSPFWNFPENKDVLISENADFIGVKIGDLNLSCNCDNGFTSNELDQRNGNYFLLTQNMDLRKNEIFTIPIISNGNAPIIAFQAGINFDPSKLELIGPSVGDLGDYSGDYFGLNQSREGKIRTQWISSDLELEILTPNTKLFNLTFKALQDIPDLSKVIQLDDAILKNEAYDVNDNIYRLSLEFIDAEESTEITPSAIKATCYPNPFSEDFKFQVELPEKAEISLWLFDAFGKRLAYQKVIADAGKHELAFETKLELPNGVMNWWVMTPFGNASGTVVKQ